LPIIIWGGVQMCDVFLQEHFLILQSGPAATLE
jgi:hypothetical protein